MNDGREKVVIFRITTLDIETLKGKWFNLTYTLPEQTYNEEFIVS